MGQKWLEIESNCAEYEADIDIPLVIPGVHVVVEDADDVYSMPTSSSVTMTMAKHITKF